MYIDVWHEFLIFLFCRFRYSLWLKFVLDQLLVQLSLRGSSSSVMADLDTIQFLPASVNTLKRLYKVRRPPFGAVAAPAIFQRFRETTHLPAPAFT